MRFGQMLSLWLEYFGLSTEEFAKLCDKHPAYLASLRRGRKGESGTDTPNSVSQDQIFGGLATAQREKHQIKAPFNSATFWAGPPAPGFQERIKAMSVAGLTRTEPSSIDLRNVLRDVIDLDAIHDATYLKIHSKLITLDDALRNRVFRTVAAVVET